MQKSSVDPILIGGCLRCPQIKMGISSGPMTLKFWQSPHFQNRDFEKGKNFSPERRSKVVKFAKNDRLEALILLARDEPYLFFPCKWSKGGTTGWVFLIFSLDESLQFCPFLKLFLTSSPLTTIIEALEIVVFVYRHILAPFMYFISQFNIQKQLPSLLNV